jgi:DNA-binding GntR family transcriptional regulator
MRASFEEHDRIVKSILSGNSAAASAALRMHIAVQGERFSDLIAQLNAGKSGR